MASSDTSDQPTPPRPVSEAEIITRMLGSDPWMRYDMWAARAWEVTEKANALALSSPPPMNSDDAVFDPRIGALFHAAEVAKEFAQMVNPITAVTGVDFGYDIDQDEEPHITVLMVGDPEETETD